MASAHPRKLHTENELYDYAIGALARRMRSVAELKRLLRQRVEWETEWGATLIELVICRLKDQGYLNDSRYAAAYSSYRRDNERFGRGDVIESAVSSTYSEIDDEKQARQYLRRKRLQKPRNEKATARIFRQLVRAGFSSKTIFKILKQWEIDNEVLTNLESQQE